MLDIDNQDKSKKASQYQNHLILMSERKQDLNPFEKEKLTK